MIIHVPPEMQILANTGHTLPALAGLSGVMVSLSNLALRCHVTTLGQRWNRVSGSPGQRLWPGRVGSRVSVSDPVFDPVLSFKFNMCIYRLSWRCFCFCVGMLSVRQCNFRK